MQIDDVNYSSFIKIKRQLITTGKNYHQAFSLPFISAMSDWLLKECSRSSLNTIHEWTKIPCSSNPRCSNLVYKPLSKNHVDENLQYENNVVQDFLEQIKNRVVSNPCM